jgi:hypothetical protein
VINRQDVHRAVVPLRELMHEARGVRSPRHKGQDSGPGRQEPVAVAIRANAVVDAHPGSMHMREDPAWGVSGYP